MAKPFIMTNTNLVTFKLKFKKKINVLEKSSKYCSKRWIDFTKYSQKSQQENSISSK